MVRDAEGYTSREKKNVIKNEIKGHIEKENAEKKKKTHKNAE